jgi:2-polyprenyl-3-methyl-5-hydroxy-6-metoxy-1,4-benzoquinol methylase
MAENKDVKEMYSEIAPFPGTLIRFLNDTNLFRRQFYKFLLRWRWRNKSKQYGLFLRDFMGHCPKQDSNFRILDVGCGTGERTLALKVAFPNAEVVGIDISPSSIDFAKAAADELGIEGIQFHVLDIQHDVAELLSLGKFDFVHSIGVLHHTESPIVALNNVAGIMSSGAIMYLMLYADYGERCTERLIREAICKLIPEHHRLHQRYELTKQLGIFRLWGVVYGVRPKSTEKIMRLRLRIGMLFDAIRTLGMSWYLRPNSISPNFDAFANPIATNFTADTLKDLVHCCSSRLKLLAYRFEPDNKNIRNKLLPHLPKDIDTFNRMCIEERFVLPWGYYIVLQK